MEFNKLQYNVSLVTTHPLIEDSNEVRSASIIATLSSSLKMAGVIAVLILGMHLRSLR